MYVSILYLNSSASGQALTEAKKISPLFISITCILKELNFKQLLVSWLSQAEITKISGLEILKPHIL